MNNARNESEVLKVMLDEQAATRRGDHPELEALAAYHEGSLERAAEDRVRDHLIGCRRCADRVLELEPLMRPEAPARDGVADLQVEAAWRRFQSLSARAAGGTGRPRRWRLLAASLAVAALALGLWGVRLRQANEALRQQVADASAPIANMPQLYLEDPTRDGTADAEPFEVPPGASHFGVFLAVPETRPAAQYEVRFVDAADRLVLRVPGLKMSDSGSLRLGLPRGLLPAGEYRVRVMATGETGERLVVEYRQAIDSPAHPTIGGSSVGRERP